MTIMTSIFVFLARCISLVLSLIHRACSILVHCLVVNFRVPSHHESMILFRKLPQREPICLASIDLIDMIEPVDVYRGNNL